MTSSFPYFVPVHDRPLSLEERDLVNSVCAFLPEFDIAQLDDLKVVGRCGCGACPTVFFRQPPLTETTLISCTGNDQSGGIVGVSLLADSGRISQLELWSVDGHEPWSYPIATSLAVITDA